MTQNPKKKVSKLYSILYLLIVIVAIGFRGHFLIGTALIMFRWILLLYGILLLYRAYKRQAAKYVMVLLAIANTLLIGEYLWQIAFRQQLANTKTPTDKEVSFMAYNLYFKNPSPQQSIGIVKRKHPDIFLAQELTPTLKRHLDNQLGSRYPYRKLLPLKGTHGIGIYAKYPITSCKYLNNKHGLPYAQIVSLSINGKRVQLINTHLASPAIAVENPDRFLSLYAANSMQRKQQLEQLKIHSNAKKFDACIVAGDFNTTVYEPLYQDMRQYWVDLFQESGVGTRFSFPNSSRMPAVFTLDYAMAKGKLKPEKAMILDGGSSDHKALFFVVRL